MVPLSTLAEFDDIRRCQAVLIEGSAEEQFLRFATLQMECRQQWLGAVQEAQRLQKELDSSLENMADLETKLFHARRLLELENKLRREAENERDQMEKKLISVAEVVLNADIQKDTREKLEFLKSIPKKRKSKNFRVEEKYGNDINSTGSFLSDLSVSHSEDDLLDNNHHHSPNVWKKHRPSLPKSSGNFIGSKPVKCTRISTERRRSRNNKGNLYLNNEMNPNDKICATTKVSIPQSGDGPIHAESIIETIPCHENKGGQSKNNAAPNDNDDTDMECGKMDQSQKDKFLTPARNNLYPSAPPHPESTTNKLKTATPNYLNIRKSLMRSHSFASKTFLKSDTCTHCQKKIRFGSVALKCKVCRVCIHHDCKELITVTCVPASGNGTPTFKGLLGCIADYAPSMPPMIPAIIIHCVHEIEARGLDEVGIYRVSGSEREVKSLKEKFLRGKNVPNLNSIDIHVLCGCVKDFLRSLREPLIPLDLWKNFTNATQNLCDAKKQSDLMEAIEKLPETNRDTLAFLMLHFQRIAECPETKMPIENIARVFGPTLVGYSSREPDQHSIYSETIIQFQVVQSLINIKGEYWAQFTAIDNNRTETLQQQFQTPRNDPYKSFYGTPLKGTTGRKERKFYATPPYSYKKK